MRVNNDYKNKSIPPQTMYGPFQKYGYAMYSIGVLNLLMTIELNFFFPEITTFSITDKLIT